MSERRCYGCMRPTSAQVCGYCGWPAGGNNDPHQLPVGTVLSGKYLVGRVLGQGGFGITYLGWDLNLDIQVCIKEFYPSATVNRDTTRGSAVNCNTISMKGYYAACLDRFLREAKALAKFRDVPQIVGIHDFFQMNNTAYMVMEFVSGIDMAKYVQKRGGRLHMDEILKILKPVMEALVLVHEAGIIHRDISPDNIMLDPRKGAILLDFGAVRNVEHPDAEKELTRATEAILKKGFAPMEQYVAKGSLGPWTDVYAMSATIYYCLTGRIPEDAPIRLMEGTELDWTGAQGLTERQRAVLEQGMAPRAKDRIGSVRELMDKLYAVEPAPVPVAHTQPQDPDKTEIVTPFKVAIPPESPKQPETVPTKPLEPVQKDLRTTPTVTEPIREKQSKQFFLLEKKKKPLWIATVAGFLLVVLLLMIFALPKTPEQVPEVQPTQPATQPTIAEADSREKAYAIAESILAEGRIAEAAIEFGKLIGYQDAKERSFELWTLVAHRKTIGAGSDHSVGVKVDGTVVAAGDNSFGQCNVGEWSGIIAISTGASHTVGLRADGTVVAVGNNQDNQCDVRGWKNVVSISANDNLTLALMADGTVVAAGTHYVGFDISRWSDITMIRAGDFHIVGLKTDGTVITAGADWDTHDVSGWTNIVSIDAGKTIVGLKDDGTVVTAGLNEYGESNVHDWTNIISINAAAIHNIGVKSDGTVISAGYNGQGRCNTQGWSGIVAVDSRYRHTLGLKTDGTVVVVGDNSSGQCNISMWKDIKVPDVYS